MTGERPPRPADAGRTGTRTVSACAAGREEAADRPDTTALRGLVRAGLTSGDLPADTTRPTGSCCLDTAA